VDVESCNTPEFIAAVRDVVHQNGGKLILSHHNFKTTCDEQFLVDKLIQAETLGADIPKLAMMPNSFDDVLTLMRATYRAKTGLVRHPVITMSMGELGQITRVICGQFGSDMTFVVGQAGSAPGQIPIDAMRQLWALLG
jgi:3-dehydroquinate dehydratase-1